MADALCHYCDRAAEAECATCGRLYCPEHGEDVCLRCLSPESATPAAAVYRGSIVALGVASLVAVFLFLRPPETESQQSQVRTIATPTATPAFATTATATPEGGEQATVSSSPTAGAETPTPEASAEATPTEAASPAVHVVQPGDTLGGIAEQYGTTVEELLALNPEISDPGDINIDQEIRLPGGQ